MSRLPDAGTRRVATHSSEHYGHRCPRSTCRRRPAGGSCGCGCRPVRRRPSSCRSPSGTGCRSSRATSSTPGRPLVTITFACRFPCSRCLSWRRRPAGSHRRSASTRPPRRATREFTVRLQPPDDRAYGRENVRFLKSGRALSGVSLSIGAAFVEVSSMATFVSLINWTEEGIHNFADTVKRNDDAKALAERLGGRLEHSYWTVGQYDLVTVADFPDDETATAF